MGIEIESDVTQIASGVTDDKGQKLEPEEQPARRILGTHIDANYGQAIVGKGLRSSVMLYDTAQQFALEAKSECRLCKHWNKRLWKEVLDEAIASPDPLDQKMLFRMMGDLADSTNPQLQEMQANEEGEMDLYRGLRFFGACMIQTEMHHSPVFSHAVSTCQHILGPNGERVVDYFEPISHNADVQGASAYDRIMSMAQGRLK